ncbi:MAG: carboxymuconolactone decarboxylase family protein [Nitriliruptoraceae bacterium]
MTQRISYVDLEDMDEPMREEMERCAREGTPRPESSAVRAHAPHVFWATTNFRRGVWYDGLVDAATKDLCRVYVSRSVNCEYCGNQRSEAASAEGLAEQQYDELLNFESSDRYDARQKAALAYAQSIAWGPGDEDEQDALWARLNEHFTEPQLVELGCFIGYTFGMQSWVRLLGIDHHQYMAGTSAAMAPGLETAEALAATRADENYWARSS